MSRFSQGNNPEKKIKRVFEKAEIRKQSGCNPLAADWQAILELLLSLAHDHLCKNPGCLLPLQVDNEKERETYLDLQEKLDLPPDTHAVLSTPSFFHTAFEAWDMEIPGIEKTEAGPSEENAYLVVISDCDEHSRIMQVSLPSAAGKPGMDVYEEGKHLADYTYETREECLKDLAKVPWVYFGPKGEWTKDQVITYTENWFLKSLDTWILEGLSMHSDFSYIHHPELLDLSPLQSVFKLLERTIPTALESLEAAIETTNELNQDMDPPEPIVTREGVLQDDHEQCQTFAGRIAIEMDQQLDDLERLEGVTFPIRNDHEYTQAFEKTIRKIYQTITSRQCPESVRIW